MKNKTQALKELKKAVIIAGSPIKLGQDLGVGESAISLYINGKRTLPLKHYITLTEKYPLLDKIKLSSALPENIYKLI